MTGGVVTGDIRYNVKVGRTTDPPVPFRSGEAL